MNNTSDLHRREESRLTLKFDQTLKDPEPHKQHNNHEQDLTLLRETRVFFILISSLLLKVKKRINPPDTLLFLTPLAPFWCFLSGVEGGVNSLLSNTDGDVEVGGFLSSEEGEAAGRFSIGDRKGLGRLSFSEGGVVERGVTGPRPFRSFSWFLWDAGDAKPDLREAEEGEEDEEQDEEEAREEPGVGDTESTLMCALSDLLRHGIFSRLTTGTDTLWTEKQFI